MAPDRVYPDGEAPLAPAAPLPPPGGYYNAKDQQMPPRGAYYNMKDQQMPPPATYQAPGRRRRSPCCCCLIWLCAIHAILLVLIGLAVLIFWLVVMPKAPQFGVQTVHISTITGTTTNGTIDYGIMARNPNKRMSFYYSDISINVQENGNTVGQGSLPGFEQGHKNTTYINGEIDNVTVTSSTLASISEDKSNVPLYAQVDLKVKAKVGSLKFGNIKVKVKCNFNVDLTVTTGSQLKSSKCKVDW